MSYKLQTTKNYGMFVESRDNRPIDSMDRSRSLSRTRSSMIEHGYLPCFPLMVKQSGNGKMEILDGQGRFSIAKELDLPVYYVVIDNFSGSIADLQTGKNWSLQNYVDHYASNGIRSYQILKQWCNENGLPIMIGAALLFNNGANSGNVVTVIKQGNFEIKEIDYSNRIAKIYRALKEDFKPAMKTSFLHGLYYCVRVKEFSDSHFIKKMKTWKSLHENCATANQFIEMIDKIYNYHQPDRVSIRFEAEEIQRDRNASSRKKQA